MRPLHCLAAAAALALVTSPALAGGPYVTVVDDGFLETTPYKTTADANAIQNKLLALYEATGSEIPNVMSVWTTFPFAGSPIGTYFMPLGFHVTGIGIDAYYPPKGLMTSKKPPLDAILMHNDVTVLPQRAAKMGAPEEGFANYLFLLELSHLFGPAMRLPAPDKSALIGFPFHWSFWMDAGGSPAGGNVWNDNGDGTFTAVAKKPGELKFSMLDLYVMGLAAKSEVPSFSVLQGAVPPAGITDPLWGGAYAAHSFPWFDAAKPFTVTATRKTFTVDDAIAATGERDPAVGAAPTSWKVGVMLVVAATDTPAQVAAAQAVLDPIATSLATGFHAATSDRGTLEIVTQAEIADAGAGGGGVGGAGGAATGGSGGAGTTTTTSSTASGGAGGSAGGGTGESEGGCGCTAVGRRASSGAGAMLVLAAMMAMRQRGRRRGPRAALHRRTARGSIDSRSAEATR